MENRLEYIKYKLNELYRSDTPSSREMTEKSNINICDVIDNNDLNVTEDMLFEGLNRQEILDRVRQLETVFYKNGNRYKKVKSAMLLSRLYNYYLPNQGELLNIGTIPYPAVKAIENQKFDEALDILNERERAESDNFLSEAMMKALGLAYWSKAFNLIEEQVQHCISKRYPDLFLPESIYDYKLRNPAYYSGQVELVTVPVRIEQTSCVGSDIFYLAMDRPHRARCINISVNLLNPSSGKMEPPISVMVRPVKEKGIRLTSIDLKCTKLITDAEDLFNMRNDDLSLLKAAVVASGIIPPAINKSGGENSVLEILEKFFSENKMFQGFEVISRVMEIPRGSGLAVSTNLLAGLILALLRFSGQLPCGNAGVTDKDKMDVAARCIYGEWLGGSGGGWQDYGGLWGGFKIITGQQADKELDPDSPGSLLPAYKKIEIAEQSVEKMLKSLVLVNGGTGQDVGPVLRMITEQYAVKDRTAWEARLRTENRYEQIFGALVSGDIKAIGNLENQDFQDRKLISPLSDNLYHEETYKALSAIFKEDLWGYDSTGGRAGAGGIYFVNPDRRKEFKDTFLMVSQRVQAELAGQIHFSSGPMIYNFEINRDGVRAAELARDQADGLIDIWAAAKPRESLENVSDAERIRQIKKECTYDREFFEELQKQYMSGKISIQNNIRGSADEISNIRMGRPGSNICEMPDIGKDEYDRLFSDGIKILKEPLAYVILNGGESTRFGVKTIRGLNPAFNSGGRYCSLIELKMRHVAFMHEKFGSSILPVFVNSFFTNENTMRVLGQNNFFGVDEGDVYNCMHQVIHRVYPKAADLVYWHETLREKGLTDKEEELARQSLRFMTEWAKLKGEGNIFRPEGRNKLYTLVSPGHYYSFMSIVSSYTLGLLIERGVKRIMVASNDNLLATVNPAILAFHKSKGNGATVEVVPRLFDRGGAPVEIGGKTVILEDFSFPDQETLWNVPFFNPISSWIDVDKLLELAELKPGDLVEAAHGNGDKRKICDSAVKRLGEKIQTYAVLKQIAEDMGSGIVYTYPVIQFEKLFGDMVGLLDPMFLLVPKALRHTQMKSVEHIYQILVDRALEILEPQIHL